MENLGVCGRNVYECGTSAFLSQQQESKLPLRTNRTPRPQFPDHRTVCGSSSRRSHLRSRWSAIGIGEGLRSWPHRLWWWRFLGSLVELEKSSSQELHPPRNSMMFELHQPDSWQVPADCPSYIQDIQLSHKRYRLEKSKPTYRETPWCLSSTNLTDKFPPTTHLTSKMSNSVTKKYRLEKSEVHKISVRCFLETLWASRW